MMTNNEEMSTDKMVARVVGALYITATVASSIAVVLLTPTLDAPDYLVRLSANEFQVSLALLLMFIDVFCVVGIGVMLYPILKRHYEAMAIGFTVTRTIEGVLFIVYGIGILSLLALSREFVRAGAPDASHFQTNGIVMLAVSEWAFSLGLRFAFGLSALILNYMLYQSRLVPRWLSGWGFVGGLFVFAMLFSELFSMNLPGISDGLIAVQEMVFAVWLIVKGFNPSAIASASVEAGVNQVAMKQT
jgi:hypothetical protein